MNYRRILFDTHRILIPADNILLNRRDSSNRTDREMTVPMIMDKVNSYEKKLRVVRTRLKGAFYRTIGDSILPISIEEGLATVSDVRDSIELNTTLDKGALHKKNRQLRSLERQIKNEF